MDSSTTTSRLVSIRETVVVPAVDNLPSPSEFVINLSNLDRQCPPLMYLVFFYNHDNSSTATASSSSSSEYGNNKNDQWSLNSVFDRLKSGLEETLSIWYPAAGRLVMTTSSTSTSDGNVDINPNPNDDALRQLNLVCNNKGAILVKAATAVKISELGGDLSQYNHFFDNLVYKPPPPPHHQHGGHFSHMPLVAAQVTKFGCGGYSIGIGISHSLFDGAAAYEFMRAWASNSAGPINSPIKRTQSILDHDLVHDRGALLTMANNYSSDGPRGAAALHHLYQLIMKSAAAASSGDDERYVHKTFHLSGVLINSLKKQFFGDSFPCSTFELVASHLWKAKTLALGLKQDTMVCLQFSVDARRKVVPPLPKGFTGNAYVLASVALTASQVEKSNHKDIVDKIREAKNSVTNNYVKSYMEALGGGGGRGDGRSSMLPPLKELTLITDWTRMPFHRAGFLQDDHEAAYASPLLSPTPGLVYFIQNPKDDKGIDLRIELLPQQLDAFTRYILTTPI